MNLLAAENIVKSYGVKTLFSDISFGIEEGDKIGLIGVNGTGKSTFLKVLAGIETPDRGRVVTGNAVQVEYLPQNPVFDDQATVLQQVFRGRPAVSGPASAADVWEAESEAKTILTKLGICDFDAQVGTLSGGQRKRVALAGALINPAELLILDEPTNHIDNETVDWLEQYLGRRRGALLMITHDRYFLDRVATRIIELDRGRLYSYTGNYSAFLELKMAREEQAQASEEKRLNLLRNELKWIKRGAKARTTKQKARIDRFEKLAADKPEVTSDKIEISVGASRLGKKVIALEHISKGFAGSKLIDDFSYTIARDDRVGIIGPNGTGKSTLLNIIAGRLEPDSGTLDTGQTVKIGYFSQENKEMDENLRVIEYIREQAEFLPTADGKLISAAQMLERFLFPAELQWTPIAKISGGERRRLYLLRVLMGAPNVLMLDEPTNDLDIQTLTILEEYLDEFPGA
ncbi:ABC-F family ATP-binding cassette domain-containing protein, partial [bacterium]